MRKWLALLAALFVCSVAALFVLRASRERAATSTAPSFVVARVAPSESESVTVDAPDTAGAPESTPPVFVSDVQRAVAQEKPSAGEPPTKFGRVVLRARLTPTPTETHPLRSRTWWAEGSGASGRLAPEGPWKDRWAVEFDITELFDNAPVPPPTLTVGVQELEYDRASKTRHCFESRLLVDLADVPARRCFESVVTLDALLAPLASSSVFGTFVWDCSAASGTLRVRRVSLEDTSVHEEDFRLSCVADAGAFVFQPNVGGAVEWLVQVDGYLPAAGRLATPIVGDYHLGAIALSRGERLTGRVARPVEGARIRAVCLTMPAELEPWLTSGRWTRRDPGGLRPMDREAPLGVDGSFELSGLFAAPYRLELRGVPVLDVVELSPSAVDVPAAGIELDTHLATVDLEVVSTSAELPRPIEVRLPTGNGSYELRRALTLDKNGRIRVPIRTGRMHEFVHGERVVPVLVHEVGSTVNVRL